MKPLKQKQMRMVGTNLIGRFFYNQKYFYLLSIKIFSLACNWSKHVTCANIHQLKLGNIRDKYIPLKWIASSVNWLARRWLAKYYSPPRSRRKKQNDFCRYIVTNKVTIWSASYSACVVYTKTIIHLSAGESGGYLPCHFAARQISTTIHLHFGE